MKDDDRPGDGVVLPQRRADVFDREAGAVTLPEYFMRDAMDLAVVQSGIDRTGVVRVRGPVDSGVVQERMHGASDQVFHRIPEHRGRARIHERGEPLAIDAIDALAGLCQDEAVPATQLIQRPLRLFAPGNVADDAAIIIPGRGLPGGQRELDRKFAAVLFEPLQFDDRSDETTRSGCFQTGQAGVVAIVIS